MSDFPERANVVVIGAGIVGNCIVGHLARLGWTDLVRLDKGPLPNPGASTGPVLRGAGRRPPKALSNNHPKRLPLDTNIIPYPAFKYLAGHKQVSYAALKRMSSMRCSTQKSRRSTPSTKSSTSFC